MPEECLSPHNSMTTGTIERSSSIHQIAQWSEWPCGKNLLIGCNRDRILLKSRIDSLQTQNTRSRSVKNPTRFLGRLVKWNNIKEKSVVIPLAETPKLLKIRSVSPNHVKLRATWTLMVAFLQESISYQDSSHCHCQQKTEWKERGSDLQVFELLSPFFFLLTYFFSFLKKLIPSLLLPYS